MNFNSYINGLPVEIEFTLATGSPQVLRYQAERGGYVHKVVVPIGECLVVDRDNLEDFVIEVNVLIMEVTKLLREHYGVDSKAVYPVCSEIRTFILGYVSGLSKADG